MEQEVQCSGRAAPDESYALVIGDRRPGRHALGGQLALEERVGLGRARDHADVRRIALVTRAGMGEATQLYAGGHTSTVTARTRER